MERLFSAADSVLVVDNVLPSQLAEQAARHPEVSKPADHPWVFGPESAVAATQRAIDLARIHGASTHLLSITTADEVALLSAGRPPNLTAAVRAPYLFLGEEAYGRLGSRAIARPPIRGQRHQASLWDALHGEVVQVMSSGHLPVRAETKDRPYPATHPGLPVIEWWLPLLMNQVAAGNLTLSALARMAAEEPALALGLRRKGRLETGYDGDLVLVDLELTRTVGADASIQSAAGWSPWNGIALRGWPIMTVLLGEVVFPRR